MEIGLFKIRNGFWTITGRSDDTLNVAGKRLGPAEMESIIVGHSLVVEAGTIGIPTCKRRSACLLCCCDGENLDKKSLVTELNNLVADKLGKALKPKAIHFVAELPKTRNAKVMRRAIKSAYLGKDGGDLSSLENPQTLEEISRLGEKNR